MRSRVLLAALLSAVLAAPCALLLTADPVRAQCGSDVDVCVTYSPEAAPPGTVVRVTPPSGEAIPVIDSNQCAPGAVVNADFIRGGVVVALSPLTGSNRSARFKVPNAAPGVYRVDLYCADGDFAATISGFQVLPPDTSTASIVPDESVTMLPLLVATFGVAFALVYAALPWLRVRALGGAALSVRHVPIAAYVGRSRRRVPETSLFGLRPRSSVSTGVLRRK